MTRDEDVRERLEEAVEQRRRLRETWRREGERPLWKTFSMIGALGWLIVAPMLVGVALGRWLDAVFEAGVTFTGALVFLGACIGLTLAWRRMNEP